MRSLLFKFSLLLVTLLGVTYFALAQTASQTTREVLEAHAAEQGLDLGEQVEPALRAQWQRLSSLGLAIVVLGWGLAAFFISRWVKPLRRLHSGVERLAAGDLSVRVPPTSRDEIGELTQAFNEMGESLQQKGRIQNAFGRYVSDYVLGQLLHNADDEELAGAEREVTILFADIRGFTHHSEGMKARDVVSWLNGVFELVGDVIQSHGGTIDKYIGDSVMAYFGAPVEQPDHARRAVAAAIEIQQAIRDRNRTAGGPDGTGLPADLGIGIHTGVVVVGNIGSSQRADYTAVGDAVNVTSRLEKLAGPGEIRISEAVQRRVRGEYSTRFAGEKQLAGRNEPVHVYSVEFEGSGEAFERAPAS